MYEIEKILIDDMEDTKSKFEEFISSSYFNNLDDTQREIIRLKLDTINLNISIFDVNMKQKGVIGEREYAELLKDAFSAKDYLIKYQKKVIDKYVSKMEEINNDR